MRYWLFPICWLSLQCLSCQDYQIQEAFWVNQMGGRGWESLHDISSFPNGSFIVTGSFERSITFGMGKADEVTLTTDGDEGEIFMARFNADGTLSWARKVGIEDDKLKDMDAWTEVVTLKNGTFILVGRFEEEATLGKGEANEHHLTTAYENGSSGLYGFFVARYNAYGTLALARQHSDLRWCQDVTVLADGSFIATGDGAFVAKYLSNGEQEWAVQAETTHEYWWHIMGRSIDAFPDGAFVTTGGYKGQVTFGPGEFNETKLMTDEGSSIDIFVARYHADGSLQWCKGIGNSEVNFSSKIRALPDGGALITGGFRGTLVFGKDEINETALIASGNDDIFIARYNTDGTLAWAKRAGGKQADVGYSILIGDSDTILLGGVVSGNALFGPGEVNEATLSVGNNEPESTYKLTDNCFFADYSGGGNFLRVRPICRGQSGNTVIGTDVLAVSDDAALVAGIFTDRATFWPDGENEFSIESRGDVDLFVMRLLISQ